MPFLKLLYCYIAKLLNRIQQHNNLAIQQFNNGFTLIELLVVIAIIAILISAATISWTNAQQKGRDAKRKTDLKAVQQALEVYFQTNRQYPSSSSGQIKCNTPGDPSVRNWGSAFTCSSITYMDPLPKDPASVEYFYKSTSPYLSYVFSAKLENNNDPDLDPTGLPCTPEGGASPKNYCVKNP